MKKILKSNNRNNIVLVAVLKDKRDRELLLKEHWYRIPLTHFPKKKFKYLALYQPAVFGKSGKRIEYYALVSKIKFAKRTDLLPKEESHARAKESYAKVETKWVKKLPKPVKNIIPRRISFGFTNLKALLNSKDILELYGVPPTETIIKNELERLGMKTVVEHTISKNGHRYRLDLAIFCNDGKIAVECDNLKAHSNKLQQIKDKKKDNFLRKNGWRVVRLKERDIVQRLNFCSGRIADEVNSLGGQ